jgi:hypothetical protein
MKYAVSLLMVMMALATSTFAATYYVGTCRPGGYTSISAAVNDATIPAGSTIAICAGVYYEQLFISKSLNLQGIGVGSSNSVRIIGSFATDRSFVTTVNPVTVRPSIVVTSSDPNAVVTVNVSNIDIEQEFTVSPSCGPLVVGIYYGSGGAGTVNHGNVMLRDKSGCSASAGVGVYVENSFVNLDTVTIQNSSLDVDGVGVEAYSGQPSGFAPVVTVNAKGNIIALNGVPGAANNGHIFGLYLQGVFTTISGNTIYEDGAFASIGIASTAGGTITGNTITAGSGISVSGGSIITGNKIWAAAGLDLGIQSATVSGNSFFGGYDAGNDTGITGCKAPISTTNSFFNLVTPKAGGC